MGWRLMPTVLGVDPGDERIGLAVSDPTGTIARPLDVLQHQSRVSDAREILEIAGLHRAELIVVGIAYDIEGGLGPQARKAMRLVEAIRQSGALAVETWDESLSSAQAAQSSSSRPLDARAAAVILQEYLDAAAHA
jgi:putative Holliday junction resolvase